MRMNLFEEVKDARTIGIGGHVRPDGDCVGAVMDAFVHYLAQCFPRLWQIHPFREGNTRTVVMMLTFFAEQHGYYMDQELMAESAGYVRDAFVMASLEQYAEREHLERILLDAVCDEPILYDEDSLKSIESAQRRRERYQKYKNEDYVPQPHYKREN